jgi:anti-anti-sigma factor
VPDGRVAGAILASDASVAGGPHVRVLERTAIDRFRHDEILFDRQSLEAVLERVGRLVDEGHTRLVLNFHEVHSVSCALLGRLAGLQRRLELQRGDIRLCGLDPVLRDLVRIAHLDRLFDVCADEAEALGLLVV